MYSQTTRLQGLTATLTAHQDDTDRLLLLQLEADEVGDEDATEPPAQVAVVIDRSGSMGGHKLDITKEAVAKLIRSLRSEDRIALVAYDEHVKLLNGMTAPSDALARKVERIEPGGSTNLYGGWVMGAKVVGSGGRVILLSDGLANAGPHTTADALGQHAAVSYQRYGVTTTTIGIGQDYDEGLMAKMAREGGGSHYYARDPEAIMTAFSQERFSIGNVAVSRVSWRFDGETKQLGHLWSGEKKTAVMRVSGLGGDAATLRYTPRSTEKVMTVPLSMPQAFGHSDEATLALLMERAADLEQDALRIRNPHAAGEVRETIRNLTLKLLAHPSADTPLVGGLVEHLQETMARLEQLQQTYSEQTATQMRKSMVQAGANLREPLKAYSADANEAPLLLKFRSSGSVSRVHEEAELDPQALNLADLEQWKAWKALPIAVRRNSVKVRMANPRDGFLISEIQKAVQKRVKADPMPMGEDEVLARLERGR